MTDQIEMKTAERKPINHGEITIEEKEPAQPPALPVVLRGNGIFFNLPYEESVERYGLWQVKILKRCCIRGKILEPGDTALLPGSDVVWLVGNRKGTVTDKRMSEEADIINKAAALGLPQKIREIVAFAQPKKEPWSVRPKAEPNE